ncbi:MAG: glycerate kinase [Erysipelotrichaceae bacterium]|nr:glycerate kinase [Erysipelotrichaceae bacterium]
MYKEDIDQIITHSLKAVLPDQAVIKALEKERFSDGRIITVAIGKAAYRMAYILSQNIRTDKGIVITKYGHLGGKIEGFELYEAGHPLPDENTLKATKRALELTEDLKENDTVIFLVSGGGSALFEEPYIGLEELTDINGQLLRCGADIKEINVIRKRLSKVKGGRFAYHCLPAKVFQIVLSDVLGNRLDAIASGPAVADQSTCEDVMKIIGRYQLRLSPEAMRCIAMETPKTVSNCETFIGASVSELCKAAKDEAEELGYRTFILTENEEGFAKETGEKLAKKAIEISNGTKEKTCLILGGETVVKVTGKGKGGRNQELVLSAPRFIKDRDIAIASVGSDGTDGPTDAAGAWADGNTCHKMEELGIDIEETLLDNDSYHAFEKSGSLIITGPTGTNVNDLMFALINKTA